MPAQLPEQRRQQQLKQPSREGIYQSGRHQQGKGYPLTDGCISISGRSVDRSVDGFDQPERSDSRETDLVDLFDFLATCDGRIGPSLVDGGELRAHHWALDRARSQVGERGMACDGRRREGAQSGCVRCA